MNNTNNNPKDKQPSLEQSNQRSSDQEQNYFTDMTHTPRHPLHGFHRGMFLPSLREMTHGSSNNNNHHYRGANYLGTQPSISSSSYHVMDTSASKPPHRSDSNSITSTMMASNKFTPAASPPPQQQQLQSTSSMYHHHPMPLSSMPLKLSSSSLHQHQQQLVPTASLMTHHAKEQQQVYSMENKSVATTNVMNMDNRSSSSSATPITPSATPTSLSGMTVSTQPSPTSPTGTIVSKRKASSSTTTTTTTDEKALKKEGEQYLNTIFSEFNEFADNIISPNDVHFITRNTAFIEYNNSKLLLSSVKHSITLEMPLHEEFEEMHSRIRLVDALTNREVFCSTSSSLRSKGQRVVYGQTLSLFDQCSNDGMSTELEFRFRESTTTSKRPYMLRLEIYKRNELICMFQTEPFNVVWRDPAKTNRKTRSSASQSDTGKSRKRKHTEEDQQQEEEEEVPSPEYKQTALARSVPPVQSSQAWQTQQQVPPQQQYQQQPVSSNEYKPLHPHYHHQQQSQQQPFSAYQSQVPPSTLPNIRPGQPRHYYEYYPQQQYPPGH